jgi:hypothetical protein
LKQKYKKTPSFAGLTGESRVVMGAGFADQVGE